MIKNIPNTRFAVSLTIAFLTSVSAAQAQIVPDKTLPVNSQVSQGICPTCTVINGGTVRGANLFHSFREFSIPTGGEAYFNNAAQIQNILTRVTGSSLSNIDGLLKANGIANLYLLNPNGIVFGPNASLNIGGSFVGTTAGSLQFPDGSEYSAINPQAPSLLAVNLVPGVQFGARPPGSTITNAGNLAVTQGQNLTLLGGTTTSTGTLTAPKGTVQVLGDRVALLDNARVDVSSPTGGGTVLVGGDYQGKGSVPNATRTYLSPNATINADATTNGNGGKVIVWADEITGFYGKISARGGGNTGDGGVVEISGKQNLAFRGNVDVSSSQGNAGTVLLDPENIIIVANGGASDAELTDSQILFGDSPGATFTVDKTALEAITGNVTLEATNNITISQGVSLNFADPIPSCTTSCPSNPSAPVKIVFKADADENSAGDFHIDPTQNIQALGRSVEISGANVIVGDIKTNLFSNGSPTNFAGSKAGDVTLTATKGNLFVGNITAKAFSDNPTENEFNVRGSGNVTLQASNGTITSGNIDTQAFIKGFVSGNGGKLTITAKGNIQTGSLISRSDAGIGGDVGITSEQGSVQITGLLKNMGGGVNVLAGSQDTKIAIDAGGVSGREIGGGGNITITANVNNVSSSSNVSSPGNIIITGKISSTAFTTIGEKPAGNVSLTANGGMVSTGDIDVSQIQDNTGFGGIPGNITINARDLNLSNATYSTSVNNTSVDNAVGQNLRGGNIKIFANQKISLTRSTLSVGTSGSGNAGNVHIEAQDINLDNAQIVSRVDKGAVGDGGDIEIVKSGSLTLKNGAQLQAQTSGSGNAGNVHIKAQDITLDNAQIFTSVENGGSGKGGNIEVENSESLTLRNGAQLEAQTSGSGDAGNIQVNTSNRVEVTGSNSNGLSSAFFTSSKPSGGKGGKITVTTPLLRLSDGAGLDARTETDQPGGNVIINAGTFEALNGGEVITTASSGGKAGDITLNIANKVTLSGSDATFNARKEQFDGRVLTVDSASGLFANTEQDSSGIGGSITITPQLGTKPTVFIRDGAKISVNSQGTGDGGNIEITTPRRITLDNHSSVTANSENGNGGNITIDPDILLLRRGSQISTSAGTQGSGGGSGGKITIDSTFIVSDPLKNNDITANAFGGSGGKVTINAKNLYWIFPLSRQDLATRLKLSPNTTDFNKLDPSNVRSDNGNNANLQNDITAISQINPTLNGVVTVNALNLDVTQGLGELNLVPIDTSQLIAQGCATGKRFTLNENRFVITGRSGIPASPEDVFRSSRVLTELDTPTVTNNLANSPATPANTTPHTSPHPIIEAQGWIVAPNGKIRLVAQSTNPIALPLQQNPITCPADSSLLKP